VDADEVARVLGELSLRMVAVEGDLVQFPVTYYFHNAEERFSLPLAMLYLLRLAEKTGGESSPQQVRLQARKLRGAIDDFSNRIGSKAFLDLSEEAAAEEVIEAYTRDHLHELPKDGD
jgi:hypothetical protein